MSVKNDLQAEDENEIIEIEVFSKNGKAVPKAKKYKIRIDNEKYLVATDEMTGQQLLELASKQPFNQYAIFQRLKGGQTEKVEYEDIVSFLAPGIERFMTLPLDQTEG
jgi:uncharacterized transporter YbjL